MASLSHACLISALLVIGRSSDFITTFWDFETIDECTSRQHFVYLEDGTEDLGAPATTNTLTSTFVNYPPYIYDAIEMAQVVVFESGNDPAQDVSNPCDSETWIFPSNAYDDNIVMIFYNSSLEDWCSVQQWTLSMENYANILALLVVYEDGEDYVTELSGDDSLDDPTVPTRVISQYAAGQILDMSDPVVTLGCYESTGFPPQICMSDTSDDGLHIHLDGTYTEIAGYSYNQHPIWRKPGLDGVWSDFFMLLFVNQTQTGRSHEYSNASSWRWMIVSTDFETYAECSNDDYPEHPAACGANWKVLDDVHATLVANNETCLLGADYLCVESTPHGSSHMFSMNGLYRQSHPAALAWLGEGDYRYEYYLAAGQLTLDTFDYVNEWVFGIVEDNTLWAFCDIGVQGEEITDAMKRSPWKCNEWWTLDDTDGFLQWIEDPMMDVDQCDNKEDEVVPEIVYDELLCFMPADYNGEYSHYQGLFGLYELNGNYIDRAVFDGRPFYNQIRLNDVDDGKWHILWFDEHDSWVVNDYVPTDTVRMGGHVFYYESWCDHATTPNNCSGTWPLYQGYEDIDEEDSDVIMFAVEEGSDAAANCMPEPNEAILVTGSANLCFDDGENAEADNPLSGLYTLIDVTYNGRYAWVKEGGTESEMFLYYDAPKRFWVIDDTLGDESYFTSPDLEVYCLQWDELQPFGCETWYFYNTVADEMPDSKGASREEESRTTSMQTMRVADECQEASAALTAMEKATSAGAIVGYVIAALVLLCLFVMIFCKWNPCKSKGQFGFQDDAQPSGLAAQQTGGIGATAGGTEMVDTTNTKFEEFHTPKAEDARPATAGANAVRSDSVTMDGDGMETK